MRRMRAVRQHTWTVYASEESCVPVVVMEAAVVGEGQVVEVAPSRYDRPPDCGRSALHWAARHSRPDVIRRLTEFFFFSSRRRHTRCLSDWSSDVCSSDLAAG